MAGRGGDSPVALHRRAGYLQPTLAELARVRGLNSRFFNNAIQSWKVAGDGSVSNVHA
jgi:sulfane dehydrogenase subunit SoxC